MKISPTEQKAYEMIFPTASQEAEISLNGLSAVLALDKPGGWVMRKTEEPSPVPDGGGLWPVRAE